MDSLPLSHQGSPALSILIITVLNSQPDNFNIPAMSGSDKTDSQLALQIVLLPFSMPCNFFLIEGHDGSGKSSCCKYAFSNMVLRFGDREGMGRGEVTCSPMIGLSVIMSLYL